MFLKKKKVKENIENKEENISTLPYDQEFKINKLKLFVVIVNRDQGDFFVKKFEEVGVGASFEIYGRGTATKEIYEILGVGETKKDIILSFVSEKDILNILIANNDVEDKAQSLINLANFNGGSDNISLCLWEPLND